MTDEMKKEYTLRISQSSRTEIIVILYELAIGYLKDAENCFDVSDREGARRECVNCTRVFGDLIGALDFSYELAFPLYRIYEYLSKEVSAAIICNDAKRLSAPIRLMESLKEAFVKLSESDLTGPVMGNSQMVYSGLTYGKGSLNEDMLYDNKNRGFTV